ncbi:MAG TPA: GIY-YIG nuclease family protein [Spirochaetia bacterium]|nr:GIY-YIG nuclease family protein [Spirochaetia bacterium]
MKEWYVYILECSDGTFYTGITDDVETRVAVHNLGKGAKYTRGRAPVTLRYVKKVIGKREALKIEVEIKRMKRREKRSLW